MKFFIVYLFIAFALGFSVQAKLRAGLREEAAGLRESSAGLRAGLREEAAGLRESSAGLRAGLREPNLGKTCYAGRGMHVEC